MNAHWLIPALLVLMPCLATAQGPDDEVATGPAPIGASIMPWDYFRGITTDTAPTPARLRIIGVQRGDADVTVRAILLDSNGNFLRRRTAGPTWSWSKRCRATDMVESASGVAPSESRWTAETAPSSCVIVVDNSVTSGMLARDVLRSLQSVLAGLAGQDSIGILLSNQNIAVISPLAPAITAATACEADSLPPSSGTSALYSSISFALSSLRQSSAVQRSVIVITASDDNGSLVTTSSDVVALARQIGASITTIRMGLSTPAYVFRYMAGATGGRLYTLRGDRPADAASAAREVLYGQKQHYTFTIGLPASAGECEDVTIRIDHSGQGALLSDSVRIPVRDRNYRSTHLIAATFPDSTDAALTDYHAPIASLCEYMMSHTERRVMLVGHVSTDYSGKADVRGLERARSVAGYMERYGVAPSQITVRSDGALRPLYYLQTDQWQRTMNNRVELQWLDPDLEPFTVAVEQVATEEMALRSVETWEQRGYPCYFEGVISNGAPVYRVKLWGFRTIGDAQAVGAEVRKRFGVETVVE